MPPQRRLKINDNVLVSEHDAELVVVNRDTGLMFGLNDSASGIFQMIRQGATLDEMHAWLAERVVIADGDEVAELNRFLRELAEAHLIVED